MNCYVLTDPFALLLLAKTVDSLFCLGDSYHILLNSFNRATFSFKTTAPIVVNKSALYEGICQFVLSSICRPVGTGGGGLVGSAPHYFATICSLNF